MTRSLGGRTVLSSRARRRAFPATINSTAAGEPCPCGQGPQADTSNPWTGNVLRTVTVCENVTDMSAEVTVGSWSADSNDLTLSVRSVIGGSHIYSFVVDPVASGGYANVNLSLWDAGGQIAGPTSHARPVNGDVLKLSAIGSTITATYNGGTVFSASDSSPPGGARATVNGSVTGTWSLELTFEDFCP